MKDTCLITVLTPTYNRAHLLLKCFESLKSQTSRNFNWMIVDDGSKDNTEDVVKQMLEQTDFDICYLKKNNGGKHTAINFGVQRIDSALTLILDSDDWLTNDAIAEIESLYENNIDDKSICGFSFLKKYPDGRVMGDTFPSEGKYNFIRWRVNYIVSGDQCDVFYTDIMKRYPFSEYPGEKFIGESTCWIKMAQKYDMVAVNVPIYIAEYLEGGLTRAGRKMRITCPRGGMEYSNLCMTNKCSFKRKIKSAILYVAYAKIAHIKICDIIHESNDKLLTVIMCPIGICMQYLWKKQS